MIVRKMRSSIYVGSTSSLMFGAQTCTTVGKGVVKTTALARTLGND